MDWDKRGERIPGAKPTEVKGHGITYRTEEDAKQASFTYAVYFADTYIAVECQTCRGWHLERS